MYAWIKRIGLVMLVVALAVGAIGTAAAQGPGEDGPYPRGMWGHLRQRFDPPADRALRAALSALRDATGLTREDIAPDLRAGMTLSEIITAQGMDPDAVAQDVLASLTAEIEQAVENGALTQERAATAIAQLPDVIERVLNASWPQIALQDRIGDRIAQGIDVSLIGVLADMAGMEPGELLRETLTPPTLAEIAGELGLDPDAVIEEAVARITERVNAAVEDGRITEEQAAQVLDGLAERLEARMESPAGRPGMCRPGVWPGVGTPWGPGRLPQNSPIA